jgi:hypothetical protein
MIADAAASLDRAQAYSHSTAYSRAARLSHFSAEKYRRRFALVPASV